MVRLRRYRQRLFAPTLVLAAAIEGSVAFAYHALAPAPPPPPYTLTLEIGGDGDGTVIATVLGEVNALGTCPTRRGSCRFDVPRDRYVTLTAVRGENMTFEGWQGCEPYANDVLACDKMMFRDRTIGLAFGKISGELEVAWVNPTPASDIALPTLPPPPAPPRMDPETLQDNETPLELALVKPPDPQLQLPPEPPPSEPEKPAPLPIPQNMRMVEVPDENQVDKAPDDATHLSDKNRDVATETAATDTNLEKESTGKQLPSVESTDTTSKEIGGPEPDIAQLEHAESEWNELDRSSDHSGVDQAAKGQVTGETGADGEDGTGGDKTPGLLAMRGIDGRGRLLDDHRGDGNARGEKGAPGLRKPMDLDDYERIVGTQVAEQERTLARARMSTKTGRWERKLTAIKSSLENFTPDVRSGNQTALKTRAHPFAVYVARMHRRIHEQWGFGFLANLDEKSSTHPLNNFDLVSVIEIALNPNGTVYKTTIAKASGKLEFDVAALDTVLSAAPYEVPPEAILSVDHRVYLRWGFYRNWRQCGTFNVEPYILTDIPGGTQPVDNGGAPTPTAAKRGNDRGDDRGDAQPVTPSPSSEDDPTPNPVSVSGDRAASYAANMWVAGFASASTSRMLRVSAVPFAAGSVIAASSVKELASVYEGLLMESGPLKDWRLISSDEFGRKAGVPSAIKDGSLVIAVVTAKERFGIVLSPTRSGEFRATQIIR